MDLSSESVENIQVSRTQFVPFHLLYAPQKPENSMKIFQDVFQLLHLAKGEKSSMNSL